jgi:hypothetical protein
MEKDRARPCIPPPPADLEPGPDCRMCGDEGIVFRYSEPDGAGVCPCSRSAPEPALFCAGLD